jgi:hypothetical protein
MSWDIGRSSYTRGYPHRRPGASPPERLSRRRPGRPGRDRLPTRADQRFDRTPAPLGRVVEDQPGAGRLGGLAPVVGVDEDVGINQDGGRRGLPGAMSGSPREPPNGPVRRASRRTTGL